MPGYTGRASRVKGLDASAFFCCVAFLSIDGIAPKAVLSGLTQVDPCVHLQAAFSVIPALLLVARMCAPAAVGLSRTGGLHTVVSFFWLGIKKGALVSRLPLQKSFSLKDSGH